jgi:RNA polymerase sigma-70 factor (TIGR02960 family)
MTSTLLARAAEGDENAFRRLTDPYRQELQFHCYRILGSMHEAEDVLQETLISAWRGLRGFQQRASFRAWLYRIATNRSLDALRDAGRRPATEANACPDRKPPPTRLGEITWLEPYPDALLEQIHDPAPGPAATLDAKESVGLAFIEALQRLPPHQRAALLLRDALGFRAAEVAAILDTSEDAVKSALKRARAAMDELHDPSARQPAPEPNSAAERDLVRRFSDAWMTGDVDGVLALLTDDAWIRMPPLPFEYQGPAITPFLLASERWLQGRGDRLVPTRANRQPAFGCYLPDDHGPIAHCTGIMVLTLDGNRIADITKFHDTSILPHFGLPRTLQI